MNTYSRDGNAYQVKIPAGPITIFGQKILYLRPNSRKYGRQQRGFNIKFTKHV